MGTRRGRRPVSLRQRIAEAPLPEPLKKRTSALRAAKSPLGYVVSRIPGGRRAVQRLLELATDDPDAVRLAEAFRHRAHQASQEALEVIAERAELTPREFVGVVARVAFDVNVDLGNAIHALSYPRIMKASVDKALEPDGVKDRQMHFEHSGFLPPRGPMVQLTNQNNQQTNLHDREPEPGEAPPFERTARRVVRNLPPA